ncbi:uncharacterized protein A4U43_C05F13220 [Asparagus officinalis]|uniref:Uncharacterized protein n=1 Tax=Asparagus officinalis TaxID=4686 RepID=A0A5P1ERI3_ASPOF|nr:uncharacterized protein A4U43_C05F13220 [Asparagus officinalis]
MRPLTGLLFSFLVISSSFIPIHGASDSKQEETKKKNKDEDSLLNSKCPRHLEMRWQSEVSSSIYATPLVADINSDGKLEVVVPSFVHYLEVLEGTDGDKIPDHVDRSHPDVHDDSLGREASDTIPVSHKDGNTSSSANTSSKSTHDATGSSVNTSSTSTPVVTVSSVNISSTSSLVNTDSIINACKPEDRSKDEPVQTEQDKRSANNPENTTSVDLSSKSVKVENSVHSQRRLLQEVDSKAAQDENSSSHAKDGAEMHAAGAENRSHLEEEADASFDLFRDAEELPDKYNYDYDDYVDPSMWGDEEWMEEKHEKLEDYVNIDSHILCIPVIADIDNDGVQEMIVAASYFYQMTENELGRPPCEAEMFIETRKKKINPQGEKTINLIGALEKLKSQDEADDAWDFFLDDLLVIDNEVIYTNTWPATKDINPHILITATTLSPANQTLICDHKDIIKKTSEEDPCLSLFGGFICCEDLELHRLNRDILTF